MRRSPASSCMESSLPGRTPKALSGSPDPPLAEPGDASPGLEFGHFERVTPPLDRVASWIGVGTTDEVAPPSEPSRPISGTRLSSWWLISKGDQPTHPDSFRVRAMDGSCCQGGQQTPNTS